MREPASTLTVENMSTIARKYTELVEEDGRKFGFESFLQTKLKIMRQGQKLKATMEKRM